MTFSKVSTKLLKGLYLLLALFTVLNLTLFLYIKTDKYYASIINISGKIRGNVQRACKLAVAGYPTKPIVYKVDAYFNILKEKESKVYRFYILKSNKKFLSEEMNICWLNLRDYILHYKPEKKDKLISLSEKCWYEMDKVTTNFQKMSEKNHTYLNVLVFADIIFLLAVLAYIFRISHKDIAKQLEVRANFDELTKALNRKFLIEFFNEVKDDKEFFPMSLIIFDLDNFKKVNDTYGHNVGDEVLKSVAEVIKSNIRKTDIFARWGGEEFVILLPNTKLSEAVQIAEKLRRKIEENKIDKVGNVTASFGVTEVSFNERLESVIKRADEALYKAKRTGKNKVEVKEI